MHPAISHFPRHVFYQGTLQDAPSVTARKPPFFASQPFELNPFILLDIKSSRDVVSESTQSRSNPDEAKVCVSLYLALARMAAATKTSLSGKVGVISPYSDQVKLLRSQFEAAGVVFTGSSSDNVEIATVDSFQGKEKDIIILSTVRACGEANSVGFLSDLRRMNVAITRAKYGLFVVGRASVLRVNPTWAMLVDNAQRTPAGYIEIPSSNSDVFELLVHKPARSVGSSSSLYPSL